MKLERNFLALGTGSKKDFQALDQDEERSSEYESNKKSNIHNSKDLKGELDLDPIIRSITTKTFKKQLNELIMIE